MKLLLLFLSAAVAAPVLKTRQVDGSLSLGYGFIAGPLDSKTSSEVSVSPGESQDATVAFGVSDDVGPLDVNSDIKIARRDEANVQARSPVEAAAPLAGRGLLSVGASADVQANVDTIPLVDPADFLDRRAIFGIDLSIEALENSLAVGADVDAGRK